MPNYQLGKIYKIESYQTNDIYIGSTCQPLCERIAGHRKDYKRWKNGKCRYITSFSILDFDDAFIQLLESYPCSNKEELTARERYWIKNLNCVNKCIPMQSPKESDKKCYEKNTEKYILHAKNYYEKNRNKRLQQVKYYSIGKKIDKMMENVNKINQDIIIILSVKQE